MSHLCEIGTLGGPHWCCTKTKHKGGGEKGVELWVELGRDVEGVAEDAQHQRPLHLELLDEEARHEAARDDQAGVDSSVGPGAEIVHLRSSLGKIETSLTELTELIEDCSFDIDSNPMKSARKLTDIKRTFL